MITLPHIASATSERRFALLHERDAAISHGLVEFVERFEEAVGEDLVDQRPQTFRRLQLGLYGG